MLLEANGVASGIIQHLASDTVRCRTLKQFANWVDDVKEVKVVLLAGTEYESSREQQANVRSAWVDATEAVTRMTK
eukprot:10664552-Karenia_brevis.AAC.1